MAPSTWERLNRVGQHSGRVASTVVDRWDERFPPATRRRLDAWRILAGLSFVAIPALVLAFVDFESLTIPMIFLIVGVGISCYVSDWVGGLAAIVAVLVLVPLLYVGEPWRFPDHLDAEVVATLVAFTVGSGLLLVMVEHLKQERATARLDSAAMRAANTALNTVEIVAAGRHAGDVEAYFEVLESLLAAMVRVNRATAGALYLVDEKEETLIRAATYGDPDEELPNDGVPSVSTTLQIGEGFVGRVAVERRPVIMTDLALEPEAFDVIDTNPHVRSVVGVPLLGPRDQIVGVAWIGLYLPYRFSPTAVARLQALGLRTVAFMESARLADAQELKLDRAEDSERRLQSVIQTMPEAVMVVRAATMMLETSNAAAQRMFGLRSERQQRSTRVTQLRISGVAEADLPIVKASAESRVVTGVELTVTLPEGNRIPVVASAAPLYDEEGDVDVVVGVFQDVRPLKEAERLRDEFLSVVSHELRSPLTPIRGFAQIIGRDLTNQEGHEHHVAWLATMQAQADRMTRLVDDLLDVSRLRSGRLMIRPTSTDLVSICRSVVESRRASTTDHTIMLDTDLESLPAALDGDRIFQVIDNLVGNAIKYTEGGTISIALTEQPFIHRATITVTDEGTGIPEAERDALFTPFYRARSAAESAVPGLGLGLYICRELIEAHGGTISVDAAESGGSRFTIALPIHA
ncbi:MAG: ATP-binding protein [Thermomicrobiales bacterium]